MPANGPVVHSARPVTRSHECEEELLPDCRLIRRRGGESVSRGRGRHTTARQGADGAFQPHEARGIEAEPQKMALPTSIYPESGARVDRVPLFAWDEGRESSVIKDLKR